MQKALLLLLVLTVFLLTACGQTTQKDESTTDVSVTAQVVEPITSEDLLSANDTYGASTVFGSVAVRDESIQYRTQDSYRLETTAIQAAEDLLCKSLAQPDSLHITDCNIWDCTDDGECVYYSVHFSASYLVSSGERLDGGFYYDVGVRKSDETTFDASEKTERVREAYSIFQSTERDCSRTYADDKPDAAASAAEQIAVSRLKKAGSGRVLSVKQRPDAFDETDSMWDVLCEGENDFGMRIPDVYTIYLRSGDGEIVEFDPAA